MADKSKNFSKKKKPDGKTKCCLNGKYDFHLELCPKACTKDSNCPVCQTCCPNSDGNIKYKHCAPGGTVTYKLVNKGKQMCYNVNGKHKYRGAYDCWNCEDWSQNRTQYKCKDKRTGEKITTTWAKIAKSPMYPYGTGCHLDPRKNWD